jgi:hypothetical protein
VREPCHQVTVEAQPAFRGRTRWDLLIPAIVASCLTSGTATHGDDTPTARSQPEALERQVTAVLQTPGYQNGHWGECHFLKRNPLLPISLRVEHRLSVYEDLHIRHS